MEDHPLEFIILINGNSKLQTYVPGQKGHQSSIFQEFKRATFRFITDLRDLQIKKSSIEIIQFSGSIGMDGHYIPGNVLLFNSGLTSGINYGSFLSLSVDFFSWPCFGLHSIYLRRMWRFPDL